jgi:flagellar hook-associated protein 1 FlgK
MGVKVQAVTQKIDHFLEQRLRGAVSDQANTETMEEAYAQLESIVGELSDTDLSTSMDNFFGSINEVLNQPESVSVRNLAMLQGVTLTQDVNRMAQRVQSLRKNLNDRIQDMAEDINRLLEEIRVLNVRIAETEGGDTSNSDAVGLRDQRLQALESLAKLIDIKAIEQTSGGVTVYRGGDFLVFEGTKREVEVVLDTDRGMTTADIHIKETDSPLNPTSGELHGLTTARDDVLGDFVDKLDDYAQTFIYEFNKLFSSGQGLNGYDEAVSEFVVDDVDDALNDTGLTYTPKNGSFQVMVYNEKTKLTQTTDITVDLDGMNDDDMTLTDLKNALEAVNGISAEITTERKLKITSDASDQQFAFANDTSGVLASLGIATFFAGKSALDMGVNEAIQKDPGKFAMSKGGIGNDTEMGVELANFLDRSLEDHNGESLAIIYDRMTGETTQGATVANADAEGARVFEITLRGQKLSISGVNLDEEAVKMIAYQRSYQASARFISTLAELFDLLVSI